MNRKESILTAAIQLFAARGFEATSTAEMAKAAGVSEGTIFHHFKSKDGVLIQILQNMLEFYRTEIRIDIAQAVSGLEAIERMIRFHFRFISEHSGEAQAAFRDIPSHFLKPDFPHRKLIKAHGSQLLSLLTEALERGLSDGSIRDVPVRQTAFILRGLLIGMSRQMLFGAFEAQDLCEAAIEFCRRSLRGNEE